MRKFWKTISIGILAAVVLAIIIIILAGAFFSYLEASFATPAEYTYSVTVRDLTGARADGNTEILVPLPYVNGAPLFSDAELTAAFNGWNSTIVATDQGRMISLKSSNGQLSDLVAIYHKRIPDHIVVNNSTDVYLVPRKVILNQSTDDIRYRQADYLKNSEHSVFYHSRDTLVDSAANDSIAKEKPYESSTAAGIRGNFVTPNYRAIAIDLNVEAGEWYIRSYTVTNETENVTLEPVVISGIKS